MCKIKINRFGPIRKKSDNNGWIDLKKVTLFIGNQGSGKSCVAKLISTFSWMEKTLIRGDFSIMQFTNTEQFRKTYCAYHRIDSYFLDEKENDVADFEYIGEAYHFIYNQGNLRIEMISSGQGELTQVMYIPAERNLIGNIKKPEDFKEFSPSLVNFVGEFNIAKESIHEPIELPINNVYIEYDRLNEAININGKDYKVRLTEASSGFQSTVPLYLVSRHYANLVSRESLTGNEGMSSKEKERFKKGVSDIWANENLSDEQKRDALSVLASKFNKSAFINIVEEPEQNLFPISQKAILFSLLDFNNMNQGNRLILTTHSPYIVNFLSVAIQAGYLFNEVKRLNKNELLQKITTIVPERSMVIGEDVAIYQLNENNGTIQLLESNYGIPSDNNLLNQSIQSGNQLFDSLLAIEELCYED